MTLSLYLDDCIFSHLLRHLLQLAGYRVVAPVDAGLTGARDPDHFAYARTNGLALITRNPDDFLLLHAAQADHAGLLLVYRENNPTRDMTAPDVVRAIQNIVTAGLPFAGQVHVLNHWRY